MTPADFEREWTQGDDELVRFSPQVFAGKTVPKDARLFLELAGLPRDAAPCLSFEPFKWDAVPETFAKHLAIGTNGSGDPILVSPDGVVLYLNHDRDFEPCFMNKDVVALAGCLLEFRRLIDSALDEMGPKRDYLDGVPGALWRACHDRIAEIDPASLEPGNMWAIELSGIPALKS